MTKPTQGKLNSQLQISGTSLGVTKLGSYLPVRKQFSCCSQEQGKAVYCLLFSTRLEFPPDTVRLKKIKVERLKRKNRTGAEEIAQYRLEDHG